MLHKYNLAFIPSKNPEQFIQYAAKLSQAAPSDKYLLGVASFPHVSLCHFEIESNQIEDIWKRVCALELPELHLTFDEKRSKSYTSHPQWDNVCWVSLIPDNIVTLTEIHLEIAKIINSYAYLCLQRKCQPNSSFIKTFEYVILNKIHEFS